MLFSSLPSRLKIFRLETLFRARAWLDRWPRPCSVRPTCSAMREQVYSRRQLLELWLQAEYSLTDVTRRQVWSARLGRERSRPRGRCGGQNQLAAAAHR